MRFSTPGQRPLSERRYTSLLTLVTLNRSRRWLGQGARHTVAVRALLDGLLHFAHVLRECRGAANRSGDDLAEGTGLDIATPPDLTLALAWAWLRLRIPRAYLSRNAACVSVDGDAALRE